VWQVRAPCVNPESPTSPAPNGQNAAVEWARLARRAESAQGSPPEPGGRPVQFVAHFWQGMAWQHWLAQVGPADGPATLYVTGDGPEEADLAWASRLSALTGGPVAVLWNVPNQPSEPDGLREDDLIATTFERFLAERDAEAVLLVPMVRSVLAALDLLGWDTVVLTGASKRAWTCWLAAATRDPRIAGIAPVVFDNLAMDVQVQRQVALWGETSPRIRAYTERGLHLTVETPEGQALLDLVDPVRQEVAVPLLSITGTRDPYWATDALSAYWARLQGPKWCAAVPNMGHDLPDLDFGLPTLAAFVRHVLSGSPMPSVEWSVDADVLRAESSGPASWQAWGCRSTDLWFSDKPWWPRGSTRSGTTGELRLGADGGYEAGLLAATFDGQILLTAGPIVGPT
jgi:PhoPQ-activated pathogenicity-related protein